MCLWLKITAFNAAAILLLLVTWFLTTFPRGLSLVISTPWQLKVLICFMLCPSISVVYIVGSLDITIAFVLFRDISMLYLCEIHFFYVEHAAKTAKV